MEIKLNRTNNKEYFPHRVYETVQLKNWKEISFVWHFVCTCVWFQANKLENFIHMQSVQLDKTSLLYIKVVENYGWMMSGVFDIEREICEKRAKNTDINYHTNGPATKIKKKTFMIEITTFWHLNESFSNIELLTGPIHGKFQSTGYQAEMLK